MNNKPTIIGYYKADKNKNFAYLDENSKLIICGNFETFPPHPEIFEFKTYPITFDQLFMWLVTKKMPVCMDKAAFKNYSKEFYKMCVSMIATNEAELENLDSETFISIDFNFFKTPANFKLN